MAGDLYDDPGFRAYRKRVLAELVPKLESSAMVVSLVPEGETDIKFAVELGLSIMLDKPIVAVVKPGVRVPPKLARVVDHWIEGDIDTPAGREAVTRAIDKQVQSMKSDEDKEL